MAEHFLAIINVLEFRAVTYMCGYNLDIILCVQDTLPCLLLEIFLLCLQIIETNSVTTLIVALFGLVPKSGLY